MFVVLGTGLARLLSFATAVILARYLGPSSFGQVAVFLAFLAFWSSSDFVDQTFVRYAGTEGGSRRAYLRAAFVVKIALNTALLVASFPIAYALSHAVFGKEVLATAILVSMLCGIGLNFLSLWAATYQADERFFRFTSTASAFYVLTFVFVLVVVASEYGGKSTGGVYLAYFFAAGLLGMYAAFRLKAVVGRVRFERGPIAAVVAFSRWLFAANITHILFQRLDIFLLAALASLREVGEYGAALRIVMLVSLLTGTVAPVLLPRATRVGSSAALLVPYVKHALVLSAAVASVVVVVWVLAPLAVEFAFGDEYRDAARIVRVFLVGTLFVALYTPLAQLFLAEDQPRKMFLLGVVKLLMILAVGLAIVPRLGGEGAALAVALAEVAAFVYVLTALRHRLMPLVVRGRSRVAS